MKKKVTIYTDGSSLGNPGFGGWGAILDYQGKTKELSGSQKDTTNNQMELTAVIKAIEILKEPCDISLFSDSSYVVKAIGVWLDDWQKNGWKNSAKKPVKNRDLWERYLEVSKIHDIKANWVKAHNGEIQNERCDKLARDEATKLQEKERYERF